MDFQMFQDILDQHGLSTDPCIEDPNFLVRIGQLPPEYRDKALGLYYADDQRMWVPPDCNEATVLHELGHRIGHCQGNDISEPFAEAFRLNMQRKAAPAMRSKPARQSAPISGQYTSITYLDVFPAVANPGDTISVNVGVQNTYGVAIHIYVVGLWSTNRFIDWQDAVLEPGQEQTFTGAFVMPANSTVVEIQVWYDATDGNVHQDSDVGHATVNVAGAYQIPSNATLQSYIIYPGASAYTGDADVASFSFTAPLTIVPGVSWLVEQLLAKFVSTCVENNATPLELKIYTQPAQLGSTNYFVQATAYSSVATRHPAMAGVVILPWAVSLVAVIVALGILFLVAGPVIQHIIYGPTQTTTTTTQPQTLPLTPNQSMAIISGSATVTAGSGGATITDSRGNKTTVPAGQTATVPAGSTVVAGSGGATVTTAAQTTTTTGPSNPQGLGQVSDIGKYLTIGACVLGGIVLIGGVIYLVAKSKGYVKF